MLSEPYMSLPQKSSVVSWSSCWNAQQLRMCGLGLHRLSRNQVLAMTLPMTSAYARYTDTQDQTSRFLRTGSRYNTQVLAPRECKNCANASSTTAKRDPSLLYDKVHISRSRLPVFPFSLGSTTPQTGRFQQIIPNDSKPPLRLCGIQSRANQARHITKDHQSVLDELSQPTIWLLLPQPPVF